MGKRAGLGVCCNDPRHWHCSRPDDGFTAPERRPLLVHGDIYGHPTFPDGKSITTSPIIGMDGAVVRTATGSRYRLGAPHEKYLAWCAENGIPFDAVEPIRMRRIV